MTADSLLKRMRRAARRAGPPRRVLAIAAVSAGALVFGAVAPASAASVERPWYFAALKLDAGAAEGFTGKGVTIAVIDGQINPEVPALQGADLEIREPSFCHEADGTLAPAATTELSPTAATDHGTNVVSMIVGSGTGYEGQGGITGVAPGATVLYYSVVNSDDPETGLTECLNEDGEHQDVWGDALAEAVADGADIISVSLNAAISAEFREAAATAFRKGVVVLGSLPNSSELTLSGGMPAGANGAIGVQAAGADGKIQTTDGKPNRNHRTDVVAPGLDFTIQGNRATGQWTEQVRADGTSLATPLTAGVMALVMEKYPEATGNQTIQSLISNTGAVAGDAQDYDANELIGYGLISVENMMLDDPTKYDDVNPLIEKGDSDRDLLIPTYEEIFPSGSEETHAPTAATENETVTNPLLPLVGIAVGVLVLIGVLVLVVLLLVRRSRRGPIAP